jgi:outer membrane lipoprotein-sorting protein
MPRISYPLLAGLTATWLLAGTAFGQTPPVRPATPAAKPPTTTPTVPPTAGKPEAMPPTIERVNSYFNGIKGLQADFTQIAPDGRRFAGVLYLLRPGRMRFEYAAPATLEVVADGRSVAIRDRKLNTQDVYFIGQTPLKFLLAPKIDVARDSKVTDLKRMGNEIVLSLEDRSTFGGTSRIRVNFDGESHALKEWTVTDPQGNDTRVTLTNLNFATLPDRSLFLIEEQKIIEPRN